MDSERLGRVLGVGARVAARTVVSAVDAATAPNPSGGKASAPAASVPSRTAATGARLGEKAAQSTVKVKQTRDGIRRGGKRFGEAVWGPFVKLSGVLWLEFTGVFFGLFAMSAGMGAWKLRGALHGTAANHQAHVQFLLAGAMAVLFGYFFVTSFLSARRRGRRR